MGMEAVAAVHRFDTTRTNTSSERGQIHSKVSMTKASDFLRTTAVLICMVRHGSAGIATDGLS